jgi:lysozyme family protein
VTYPSTFETAFARLVGSEGGFSNDSRDPGNWTGGRVNIGALHGTKFGIAANTYPDLDIANLTLDGAKAIYYRDWWQKLGADELPPAIVFQCWDFAVNAGMANAMRALQYAAGVAQDGHVGPLTIAAAKQVDPNDLLLKFNAFRLRYYTSLSTFGTYGKGWVNRVAQDLDYAAADN